MSNIKTRLGRLINGAASRLFRGRRGSVLILVVLLLVLMALLGTAFLVTSRNDLIGSKLYEHNVQIDMLVQGVENMALGVLTDSTYQSVPQTPQGAQYYDDWFTSSTAFTSAVDHSYLASRYPTLLSEAVGNLQNAAGTPTYPCPKGVVVMKSGLISTFPAAASYLSLIDNNTTTVPAATNANWALIPAASFQNTLPVWPAVSAPLAVNTYAEDPTYPSVKWPGETVYPRPDGVRTMVQPTSVTLNGVNYPALKYWSTVNGKMEVAMAASASGNGIADSFLWRLPVGSIDGITYYAAVRIIDDNSAVNANTANSSSTDFNYKGEADLPGASYNSAGYYGFLPGIFPSGIGLAELTFSFSNPSTPATTAMINSDSATPYFSELSALNNWRWGGLSPGPQGIVGDSTSPIDDSGTAHAEFQYRNLGDALWMGLGRRIGNPGYSGAATHWQSLGWSESAQLAYKFDMVNPVATPSVLERCLVNTLYNLSATPGMGTTPQSGLTFRKTPWDASNVQNWYGSLAAPYQSNPLGSNSSWNRRAYVVARNPTSNCMPAHTLNSAVTGLSSSDLLTVQNLMAGSKYFGTTSIPKVSLNTADVFWNSNPGRPSNQPTLWLAFYNAMLDSMNAGINYANAGTTAALIANSAGQGGAQFRSPLRDINGSWPTATTYMTGPQTILLRSLIAAANAKDLSDSDDNVTIAPNPTTGSPTATITIKTASGTAPVNMYAYGLEKQPFIVEVYANTETTPSKMIGVKTQRTNAFFTAGLANPKGYVAIELYNPYDVAINMKNWTLGVLNRTGYPAMAIAGITGFNGFGADGQNCTILPHQYMFIENMVHAPGVAGANDATYRPWTNYFASVPAFPLTVSFYYVQNLHEVINDPNTPGKGGGELILLRQQLANGAFGVNGNPANIATISTLKNFAPVDSFDFSGLSLAPSGTFKFTAIHYMRPSPGNYAVGTVPTLQTISATQTLWKFVYPGRWSPTAYQVPANTDNVNGTFFARQEGIAVSSWNADPANAVPNTNTDFWTGLSTDFVDKVYALGSTNSMGIAAASSQTVALFANPITLAGNFAYLQPICFTNNGSQAPPKTQFPYQCTYPNAFPPIQLNNTDFGGPTKNWNAAPFAFPFGGFARVGDVLQVPYIGSYIILNAAETAVVEINPVTRDAALADDLDYAGNPYMPGQDDPLEQVGRFCPLLAAEQSTGDTYPVGNSTMTAIVLGTYAGTYLNGQPYLATGTAAAPGNDLYAWAAHIFDYFSTIQNPNDDYFPNIDPITYSLAPWSVGAQAYLATGYAASPIANSGNTTPNSGNEDIAAVDGLINLNTASATVLSAVPFIPLAYPYVASPNPNGNFFNMQQTLAKAIVTYRNTYGPFKSLFDLNRVTFPTTTFPAFTFWTAPLPTTFQGLYGNPATVDFNLKVGDISPLPSSPSTTSEGVTNDFETRFNSINRVSNLLTTRSDTYTVYILVQGWSGVGTSNAVPVVTRRVAFIVDRSKLTGLNRTLDVHLVQSN